MFTYLLVWQPLNSGKDKAVKYPSLHGKQRTHLDAEFGLQALGCSNSQCSFTFIMLGKYQLNWAPCGAARKKKAASVYMYNFVLVIVISLHFENKNVSTRNQRSWKICDSSCHCLKMKITKSFYSSMLDDISLNLLY